MHIHVRTQARPIHACCTNTHDAPSPKGESRKGDLVMRSPKLHS